MDLENISLLKNLSKEKISYFEKNTSLKTFKKGEYIFKTGDEPKSIHLICEGLIKVGLDLEDGREQIIYILDKGDFIGAFNIMYNNNYLYNAIALTNCKVRFIDKNIFNELFLNNVDSLKIILDKAFKRIRSSEELIYRLNEIDALNKTMRLLDYLIRKYGVERKDKTILLDVSINRQDLGSFSGLSRETISRKLNLLEEKGIIKLLSGGRILVLKTQAIISE